MYIPALAAQTQSETAEPSARFSHYWCNCTLTETGPDDKAVGPDRCQPTRSCFRP